MSKEFTMEDFEKAFSNPIVQVNFPILCTPEFEKKLDEACKEYVKNYNKTK